MASHTITVEQAQQSFDERRGELGARIAIASGDRVWLEWSWSGRRYEVSVGARRRTVYMGSDLSEALAEFNKRAS